MTKNKIISIQSRLVYGYVGNNIAEFAIQLHGLDVISFPTVLLSTHTGHSPIYGEVISKKLFDELTTGIEAIGVIESTFSIITGYIRTEEILESTHQFISKIKEQYPDKLYVCDPVMGEMNEGLYIPENVAHSILNKLIPLCDILTPNHFELEYILGSKVNSMEGLVSLVKENSLLKGKTVVATGCHLHDTPEGIIETIIVNENIARRVHSQLIDTDMVGTGDLFTSTFSSQLAIGKDIFSAAEIASAFVSKVLSYTINNGYPEMNAESILKSTEGCI